MLYRGFRCIGRVVEGLRSGHCGDGINGGLLGGALSKAGNGGDGSASFRREKYVPKGGPDGGDGGRGGSVYLRVNPAFNTLLPFHYKQHFKAQHGGSGASNQKHGKAAPDV